MMYFFKKNFFIILIINVIVVLFWMINFFTNQYNPYTNFISLAMPKKFLVADTLIIKNEEIWDSSPVLDNKARHYFFYGYLKNDKNFEKKYSMRWKVGDNPHRFVKEFLTSKGNTISYIPVFKSKIQKYAVYPRNDPNYMFREAFEDLFLVVLFSIPLITILIYLYIFRLRIEK